MTKLRVAVVGVGHLGQHHARVLASIPDVELVGVADARIEQARAVAEKNGTRAFADYRELLDLVDAVSVAVPTALHLEIASAFLERGIATMVEKPLATSLDEAERIVALARAHNAVLQVGHIERFNPALSVLEGLHLRPKYISAERLSTYTFRSTDIGAVLDIMIHDIDLILSMIAAPVRSVAAVGVSIFGGHEDVANARVEFDDGCVVNLTASRASYQSLRRMRLWGEEGYATLDFAAKQGTIVRPSEGLRHGVLDLEGVDMTKPAEVKDRLFGKILRIDQVQAEGREPLALELEEFVRAISEGARPKVGGDEALRAMRLADQILQQINTHQWEGVATGPVGPHLQPATAPEPTSALRGPISWRNRNARKGSSKPSNS